MLTIIEAQRAAKQYAKKQGEIAPGIYFDVGEGKTFSTCHYFDYSIVDENGNIHLTAMIGGAPGVTVNKHTGETKDISFGDLSKLK